VRRCAPLDGSIVSSARSFAVLLRSSCSTALLRDLRVPAVFRRTRRSRP
jgi:hypothetical protein